MTKKEILEKHKGYGEIGYVLKAMDEYTKQEAIAFVYWVGQNELDVTQGCPHLNQSPEELYTLYQSQNK